MMLVRFRETSGVVLPHRTTIKSLSMEIELEIERLEHNVEIPPGRFDLPADVEKLLKKPAAAPAETAEEAPAPDPGS